MKLNSAANQYDNSMSKRRTLTDLKNDIDKLLKAHPEYAKLPIIYSSDDEGNSYHGVYNTLTPMQADDPDEHYVDIVGSKGDEDISDKDINVICIN